MSTIYFQVLRLFGSESDKESFFRTLKEMCYEIKKKGNDFIKFVDIRYDSAEAVCEFSKKYPEVWAFLAVCPEHDMSVWEIVYHAGSRVSFKYFTMYHPDYERLADELWKPYNKLTGEEVGNAQ